MSSNSVTTAVTGVTPKAKGRAPVMLKNGKSLADARIEAKANIKAAKYGQKVANTVLKADEKRAAVLATAVLRARDAEGRATTALSAASKNPILKQGLKDAKAAHKNALTGLKAASRLVSTAGVGVTKASAVLGKALDAAKKIEDANTQRKSALNS